MAGRPQPGRSRLAERPGIRAERVRARRRRRTRRHHEAGLQRLLPASSEHGRSGSRETAPLRLKGSRRAGGQVALGVAEPTPTPSLKLPCLQRFEFWLNAGVSASSMPSGGAHAWRAGQLRRDPVLLFRPVRDRAGVLGVRHRVGPGRVPQRTRKWSVRRVLAGRRSPRGRRERHYLERQRARRGADTLAEPRRPCRADGSAHTG